MRSAYDGYSSQGRRLAPPDIWEEQVSQCGEDAVNGKEIQEFVVAGGAVYSIEYVFCDPHCHEQDADHYGEAENGHKDVAVIGPRGDSGDQGECPREANRRQHQC